MMSRAKPTQHEFSPCSTTSPATRLSSYALNAGDWKAANGPMGVQVLPPPPPIWCTEPPTVVLCTMIPRASSPKRLPPIRGVLDSVGADWLGSSKHGDEVVLQPRKRTP